MEHTLGAIFTDDFVDKIILGLTRILGVGGFEPVQLPSVHAPVLTLGYTVPNRSTTVYMADLP